MNRDYVVVCLCDYSLRLASSFAFISLACQAVLQVEKVIKFVLKQYQDLHFMTTQSA